MPRSTEPGLKQMIEATPEGFCPYCLDPLPKSKTKPRVICGAPECEVAYQRGYHRDLRRKIYKEKNMAKKEQEINKLVKSNIKVTGTLMVIDKGLKENLTALASLASMDLTPEQLAEVFKLERATSKVLGDDIDPILKQKVIAVLKERGKLKEDTKGLYEYGTLSMKPYRTGEDPKKVEKLLRARGKDPAKFMLPTVSYAMPPKETELYQKLVKELGDELEACKYDESWTVNTPK